MLTSFALVLQDNVLADESGEALLCDFGLCRIRYEISRTYTEIRQGGRVRFVAPELWSGQRPLRINEASDTYSLAMTIYALGTHRRPLFKYDNDFTVVNAIQTGARPEEPESLGGLPPHKTGRTLEDHECYVGTGIGSSIINASSEGTLRLAIWRVGCSISILHMDDFTPSTTNLAE